MSARGVLLTALCRGIILLLAPTSSKSVGKRRHERSKERKTPMCEFLEGRIYTSQKPEWPRHRPSH